MLIEQDSKRPMRLIVSGVLFLVIAAMVARNSMLIGTLDSVLQTLFTPHHATGGFVHGLMVFVSFLGSPKMDIIWVLTIAFFLWGFKGKIPALWAILTLLGGDAVGTLVKHLVKRARPAQHLAADNGFSFPSGHVLGFFLVAGIIVLVVLPLIRSAAIRVTIQALLVLLTILLAISRVYLLAHFPFDTLGAMLLAYTWLQIAEFLYVAFAPRLTSWRLTRNSWY